jgi:hypothetical protein
MLVVVEVEDMEIQEDLVVLEAAAPVMEVMLLTLLEGAVEVEDQLLQVAVVVQE